MSKKSNVKRPDGRIKVDVYIGRVGGKRKYKSVYGKTQKEADEKAKALKESLLKGINIDKQKDTFNTWCDSFLVYLKPSLTEQQYHIYEARLNVFRQYFGETPISKINLMNIQQVITDLAKCNPTTNKPTARKTLIEYSAIIKRAFDFAVYNKVIAFNPITMPLSIPKTAPKEEREAITDEQIKWIEETPHRMQTAAMIMLYAGLRRGEVSALKWSDIDIENKRITVNKSYDFYEKKEKSTKTEAGMRTVPIPDKLVEQLKKEKKERKKAYLSYI